MLQELESRRLKDGMASAGQVVTLEIHPSDEQPKANERLAEVARAFEIASGGKLVVRPGDGRDMPALPGLVLRTPARANIRYLALPEEYEEAPFVEALVALAHASRPEGDWVLRLLELDRPAEVLVFIAGSCPHCPQAVRAAIQLALASDAIQVTIIDAQFFEGLAGKYKVRSVPTTILDGGYTIIGVEPAIKLAQRLLARDDPAGEGELFTSLLDSGRLDDAAQRIVAGPALPAFLGAWRKSTTAARVALMLCAQKAMAVKREALDPLVGEMLALLEVEDAALRGDTADLLGQIGHLDAAGALKTLLDDPNPDVAEIAEESLDSIMDRNG